MSARGGDWIQTYSGNAFWPLDPRPEDIHIEDIAHALSNQCRYAGHVRRFYSVAEHCVLLARAVAPRDRLWALLHEAGKAWLGELSGPVSRGMPDYARLEAWVMAAVCIRYGLPPEMPLPVEVADCRLRIDEREQALAPPPMPRVDEAQVAPLGVRLQFWSPAMAEQQFLWTYDSLCRQRGQSLGGGAHG